MLGTHASGVLHAGGMPYRCSTPEACVPAYGNRTRKAFGTI